MGMKSGRRMFPVLLLSLCLLLCGCRTRTDVSSELLLPEAGESQTDEAQQGESMAEEAAWTDTGDSGDSGETGSRTTENPESSRKEYDENAPAEIVPGTDRLLHQAGEGNGASASNEEAGEHVNRLNDQAGETATRTVAAGEAEQMGVSEDAEAADSALTYFTVLLQDRMGSLFECQRLNVYWETVQDHVTIHRTSPEHTLILNAGCYDVSSRLLPENLLVDDGWVARKNPGVIVKIVDSGVPGSKQAARAMIDSMRSREGWTAIDAVQNHRILLLSEDLLQTPSLQTAAMVLIAGTANPGLFADVDPDQMLQMLVEEATGTLPTAVYYYRED